MSIASDNPTGVSQIPMPRSACVYCGNPAAPDGQRRQASEADRAAAALHRQQRGKPQLNDAAGSSTEQHESQDVYKARVDSVELLKHATGPDSCLPLAS